MNHNGLPVMKKNNVEEAANWIDKLHELNNVEKQELIVWLQDRDNKIAFDKMAKIFGDDEIKAALHSYSNESNSNKNKNKIKSNIYSFPVKVGLAACFAAFAIISYVSITPEQLNLPNQSISVLNTTEQSKTVNSQLGERISTLLQDGSFVHLNADSDIDVLFKSKSRHVVFNRGQVFFDVAKDSERPFLIESNQATIKVLGTSFDVEKNHENTVVTVYEGKVSVTAGKTVTLIPPQQAIVKGNEIIVKNNLKLNQLPAWRTGWIELNQQPFSILIDKLQSYSAKKIIISNQLDKTIISGRFKLDTPYESIQLVAATYDWSVSEDDTHIYIQSS
ncbi:FecR domain-containing protein [Pseudoalteromonas sp. S1727]|uniref:FecR family protein n=1 Tax=Pseudoalteromonas sp. S1727 TaxID=2066514 RepID=UPI001107B756|nr:FecR domain-containing protein [Pseudoalteromonas sp. S1727]